MFSVHKKYFSFFFTLLKCYGTSDGEKWQNARTTTHCKPYIFINWSVVFDFSTFVIILIRDCEFATFFSGLFTILLRSRYLLKLELSGTLTLRRHCEVKVRGSGTFVKFEFSNVLFACLTFIRSGFAIQAIENFHCLSSFVIFPIAVSLFSFVRSISCHCFKDIVKVLIFK